MSKINFGYTRIYSPIDGLIGKTEAREGEFVGREPNPVILNVVSNISKARVQFFLNESEYLMLAREIAKRTLEENAARADDTKQEDNLELILADGTIYENKGSIEFLGREIDVSTGSILLQAVFENVGGILRPGMFAKVRVQVQVAEEAILVPQRCVTELQGQYSVYVVEEGNIVKARQVAATERLDDLWLIEEGLNKNDRVVIDGLQKVASGMEIVPVAAEYESPTENN